MWCLPQDGDDPIYAQLYIHNSIKSLEYRTGNPYNIHSQLDPIHLYSLHDLLDRHHPAVCLYK